MTDNDEFDRAIRRAPVTRLPADVRAEHLRMLSELPASNGAIAGIPRRTGNTRRVLIVAAALVLFAGGGVGIAYALGVFSAAPTDRTIAHCYTTVDLDDPTNHLDIVVATDPNKNPSLHDAAALALDICRGGWQQGRFSSTDPKIAEDPKPPPWDYPVPTLVACVLPSGQVGVFPGGASTCGRLGLPNALV